MKMNYINCTGTSPSALSSHAVIQTRNCEQETRIWTYVLWRPSAVNKRRRFVFSSQLRRCCRTQCLVKLYHCDYPFTQRLHEDQKAQRLRSKHLYGQVHATTTRQACNDYNPQQAHDTELTVSMHIRNDVRLYQATTLGIERNDELPSKRKMFLLSHHWWTLDFKCICCIKRLWRSPGWTATPLSYG